MGQKYLVVSDNHGDLSNLSYVLSMFRGQITALIHCGDMEVPPEQIRQMAGCPVYMAQGNCDPSYGEEGVTVLNPGSIERPRQIKPMGPTFMLLDVEDDGQIIPKLYSL